MTAWLDELSQLDGDELYELIGRLADNRVTMTMASESPSISGRLAGKISDMAVENYEVFLDVLKQVARITVPYKEAQGVIWRAIYARNHPVRVPGTN